MCSQLERMKLLGTWGVPFKRLRTIDPATTRYFALINPRTGNEMDEFHYLLNLPVDDDLVPLIIVKPDPGWLYMKIQSPFGQRHPHSGSTIPQRYS